VKTLRVYGKADHLIPEGWRWRIACAPLDGGGYELLDPKTKTRLAVVVPEGDGSYVVADGNMVTRWYTLEDAVLYAAQARGEWDRPWPLSRRQFWGDGLRCPWTHIPSLVAVAFFAAQWATGLVGRLGPSIAVVSSASLWYLLARFLPGQPEADYDQGDDGEVDGWPEDPRWSALFDSTAWYPGERSGATILEEET
jgi:hypothetical protein